MLRTSQVKSPRPKAEHERQLAEARWFSRIRRCSRWFSAPWIDGARYEQSPPFRHFLASPRSSPGPPEPDPRIATLLKDAHPFEFVSQVRIAGARRMWYTPAIMRPSDLKKLLKVEPFAPIRLGLSDGRAVVIRHPDQVVVAERHLLVGLATIERSGPLATPRSSRAVARDWLIVNLLHIATIEPMNAGAAKPGRKPRA